MSHCVNERYSIQPLACIYSQWFDSGVIDRNVTTEQLVNSITATLREQNVAEFCKSNARAAKLRNAGNRLYLEGKYPDALARYNESICFAEVDSDQLSMGFANRSAVYYEMGEYEFALLNIALAKKHDYPEKLMPKLLAREQNCRQKMAAGQSKNTVPRARMQINVDTNPRIPFLADDIVMNYDAKFGRGLVAERKFNAGDIILEEKSELSGVDFCLSDRNCNHCGKRFNYSLIPCPKCIFFMYCSQECLEQNWKFYHRFECDVATKLYQASANMSMIYPRLFFYGLTHFEDDIHAMMNYCEKEINPKFNPLDQDYTNLSRLELFKAYHNTKVDDDPEREYAVKLIACSYYVVLLKNPAVTSIIRTAAHRRFFLKSLLNYVRIGLSLATPQIDAQQRVVGTLTPFNALVNHSCDPHAITIISSGIIKVILIRPVRKGEQIFTSYGPVWFAENPGPAKTPFPCRCIRCDRGPNGRKWRTSLDRDFPLSVVNDLEKLLDIAVRMDISNAAKMNALQQFINRYAPLYHPERNFGSVLDSYRMLLVSANRTDVEALERVRALEAVGAAR